MYFFNITSLGWVIGSLYVVYLTNFFRTCWESELVDRFFFDIALFGVGINVSLMMYISLYLPIVTG